MDLLGYIGFVAWENQLEYQYFIEFRGITVCECDREKNKELFGMKRMNGAVINKVKAAPFTTTKLPDAP